MSKTDNFTIIVEKTWRNAVLFGAYEKKASSSTTSILYTV